MGLSSRKLIVWVTLAYIAMLGAALLAALWVLRLETISSHERLLRAYTSVAEEQTTRTFQSIDQTLLLARNILTRARTTPGTPPGTSLDPEVGAALRDLLVDRPFLRSFWLLDAAGTIVFNSAERYVGNVVADRPFFTHYYKENPDQDFAIHTPVRSRATGQWYPTATRSWRAPSTASNPRGELLGVIVATPERDYFEKVWSVDDLGAGASISLFGRDGYVLMRSPHMESLMGRSFADSLVLGTLVKQSPSGIYQNTSVTDDQRRILSYRALSAYPGIVLIVGQTVDRILAPWRRYVVIGFATWAAGSLAAAFIITMLAGSLRARERDLEAARLTNQRIFDTSVDLILATDRTGNIVQVSPSAQAILGYTPQEMVGQNGVKFTDPRDLEQVREEMRAARRGQALRNFEANYIHKSGKRVVLNWSGVWSDAAQQHFFIGRDMTNQRSTEQQLRQAQKMEAVGQLTGGIAHDFNNLLTVIIGNSEILAESLAANPELKALAEMVDAAAQRGADLTKSLLAFARRQTLQPTVVDANELVGGMQGLLRRTLGESIEIAFKLSDALWRTTVDPSQLESALLNLAVNARDAMQESARGGGRLTIETANAELDQDYALANQGVTPGAYVMLGVTDTGTGMSADVLARVFDPFFTTKEVGKSSGLGLSMVYGFAKQSNGHVKIYSEPGHGTTVRLYLPRAIADLEPAAEPVPAPEMAGGSETILVVEDDENVRSFVERQLRGLGYRVIAAGNGPEAIELLRGGHAPDLLFTDVVMPQGMNGPQLAEAVRLLKPDIKVLFTSGYTENAIVHHGTLDPGVELLSKPYRRHDLALRVRKVLDARPRTPV